MNSHEHQNFQIRSWTITSPQHTHKPQNTQNRTGFPQIRTRIGSNHKNRTGLATQPPERHQQQLKPAEPTTTQFGLAFKQQIPNRNNTATSSSYPNWNCKGTRRNQTDLNRRGKELINRVRTESKKKVVGRVCSFSLLLFLFRKFKLRSKTHVNCFESLESGFELYTKKDI